MTKKEKAALMLERKPSPVNGVVLPEGKKFEAGEEAREKGRRGGKKSGEVRRARKTMREDLLELLKVKSKDEYGITHTQQEYIIAALIIEARNGNVRAFEVIRDTIGEKQTEHHKISVESPRFDLLDAAFIRLAKE